MVNESKVLYKSKNGNDSKEFAVLDFIASIASHIPPIGTNRCYVTSVITATYAGAEGKKRGERD
ncbi:MAG: hypothetical protein ACYCXQ_14590 [Candidatus Humimicrobiaceae bacterium]